MIEDRLDFSGGLNTANSPDILNRNELVQAINARSLVEKGAVAKRTGTRRMHETAIGGGNPITGLMQWDYSSDKQLVAICNGKLYHKTSPWGNFTEVDPATDFSTTAKQSIQLMRASASGAPLRMYLADGNMQRWTGVAVTNLTGTNDVPPADLLMSYHVRMFSRDKNYLKSAFWSVLGDPEDNTVALGTGAGNALIDVLTGEQIVAFERIGSSLMIFTEDSIVQYTGYSSDDIRIYQDTEGVDTTTGVVGQLALSRIGKNLIAFLSAEGVLMCNEVGSASISDKIIPSLNAVNMAVISNAVVGYHKGRREVYVALAGTGDDSLNKTVYVYSEELACWMGPWTYPFGITTLVRFEDANGDEWLMAGCSDGFVRHMDIGAKDDVLFDASAGSTYTMTAELAPYYFRSGPGYQKSLKDIWVSADIVSAKTPKVKIAFDAQALASYTLTGTGTDAAAYNINRPGEVGKRLRVVFVDDTDDIAIFRGLSVEAFDLGRK
jgi:hypothetical protein